MMKKIIFGMIIIGMMLAVADTVNAQGVIRGLGDKCIEVKGGETYSGANVQLWECHGGSNQLWYMNMEGEIVNEKSKKCLTAMGTGKIAIWTCDGEQNTQWRKTSSGEFRGAGNKCLDLSGSNTNNGTPILLYQCTGKPNQKWQLVLYKPTVNHNPPNSSFKYCAREGQICRFKGTGTVAYGANGKFKYKTNVAGSTACTNSSIGDPVPGVPKRCYYKRNLINGRNAGFVRYNGGTFVSGGQKSWFEYKNGKRKAHATFYETGRDQWSVYLKKSDGAIVQLNIHKKEIKLNGQFIYKITEARER